MNLSHPHASIIPSITGFVLEVLAETTRPLSGREVRRLLGRPASHRAVQQVLHALAGQGVVIQQSAGSAIMHSLNREHVLLPVIEALVAVRHSLCNELASIVRSEAPDVTKAILFGSVVSRTATEDSDVDLLLVWPDDASDQMMETSADAIDRRVRARLGNPCRPLHYTVAEFGELAKHSPELARSLAEGQVDLLSIKT